jgi:signal peptidase I
MTPARRRREIFYIYALFVIVAAFVVRGSMLEPFLVPTGSMMPTVAIGDVLLVNKAAYCWRVPFKSEGGAKVGAPSRGTVMVFRKPADEKTFYVKRVIGVPGDLVMVLGRKVYVNGHPWESPQGAARPVPPGEGLLADLGQAWAMPMRDGAGHSYEILLQGPLVARIDRSGVWELGPGEYFVMGDNRDTSNDSRDFGPVSERLLVGKVERTLFNRGAKP